MSSVIQKAPHFSTEDAVRIAKTVYNLECTATCLPSERDQNFHLVSSGTDAYVLKIANVAERFEVLECQNQALMHVAAHSHLFGAHTQPCPQICTTMDGELIASIKDSNGTQHWLRLLTYLPGKPMAKVVPHDAALLFSLGTFLGNLDRTLETFDHPAAHYEFYWDLKQAGKVVTRLKNEIPDPSKQGVIDHFLERFQTRVQPKLAGLRTSIIHGDANDYNVLVQLDRQWRNSVSGMIDYGDIIHSYTINELAIGCAYAMMNKKDPLSAGQAVVAGYHAAFPLAEEELAVLYDLICMRLCTSVCQRAHQTQLEPENEYLCISEKPAWALLNQMAEIHPRFAHYTFRHACGLPPLPAASRVVSWLQIHQGHFHPIMHQQIDATPNQVADLSISSPQISIKAMRPDLEILGETLEAMILDNAAGVVIGRYNEARLIYTTDQYAIDRDTMPEQRSIHIGLDLFAASSTPIMTPWEGVVHSYQNNADHLDYGPTIILEHRTGNNDRFFTLYGHLSLESIQELIVGQVIQKGQAFAQIGTKTVNGGWPPHLHFQIILDLLGETGNFPGVAQPSQRAIWMALCPDPNLILGLPTDQVAAKGKTSDEILTLRHKHLGRNLSIAYRQPLKIVRGIGPYLISDTGQYYLDGVNNVCHVGHCHPHVVKAGQRQMAVLNTNTRYLHDNIVEYAQRLLARFPEPLSVCYFVSSGSEANELALRLARNYTGRQHIITVEGAYHGNTQGLIDISPYKHDGPGGQGTPLWVQKVVMPCGYRGPHKGSAPQIGARYAAYVREAVHKLQVNGQAVAAFICESMLGCGGQIVLPQTYLQEAFQHVRQAGGVCIADEVQVGFGRVGTHFWAFETQGIVPDIVTLGKPIGNGHPLAAVITTAKIADAFNNGMEYFNTYGGNPVSCAIGMAVLDVIENEGLQENARTVGAYLLEGLEALKMKYALIGDVRGLGLCLGVELVKNHSTLIPAVEEASYIINRIKDYGVLLSTDGPLENILKLKPPIVFSRENADQVIEALNRVFADDCLRT